MANLEIPCPNCGALLRLPDRSMLGRKGKCGKCAHKFILEEPEISFDSSAHEPSGNETIVGVAAQWVPASAPVRTAAMPSAPPPPAPVYARPPEPVELVISLPEAEAETGGVARLKAIQRRNKRGRNVSMAVGMVVIAACVAAYLFIGAGDESKKVKKAGKGQKATAVASAHTTGSHAKGGKHGSDVDVAGKNGHVPAGDAESPTNGKPIELLMIPSGARLVINIRPAELWEAGGITEEVRACLGPIAAWLEASLKTVCLTEPAAIEEALICFIPAKRGSPPDLAVVVRTKNEFKKSELLEKFNGEMKNDAGRPYYVGEQNAYLILDTRTYAISPSSMAQEMVQSADNAAVSAEGIEALLAKTDRTRHFTMVFDPVAVRIDAPFLVPENAKVLLDSCLDWVGDDIEAVALSFHFGEKFFSEVLFRNQLVISPPKLQKVLEKQLVSTPQDVLSVVKQTHPQEFGKRKIIGRFPAMTKVFALSTHVHAGNHLVSMKTELPDRAAPNLALGALLTWDQTTRPDYGQKQQQPTGPAKPKLPETFAERLQKKISVDFRKDFMYAALAYVEEETGTKIKIDGNGLKFVGVTQNEKQEFKMDDVPAVTVLDKILTPRKLVIVIDEKNKIITVTSAATAEEKKLEPFPLTPAK